MLSSFFRFYILCPNTQMSFIYCHFIYEHIYEHTLSLNSCYNIKFPFQISYHLSGEKNLYIQNLFLLKDFVSARLCVRVCVRGCVRVLARARACVCVCEGRVMHSLTATLKNILCYLILNHSKWNCSKMYIQANTTSLVQKFNFRLWSKAHFPRAIFSSAAHGSAAKDRNSYFHEGHCRSLLSPPSNLSPPSSAAQNSRCRPRGYAGPCGWSVSIAITLTAALRK
jgi:hypothetical protein